MPPGLDAEIEVYKGAQHGWCPPDSAVYSEEHAERAWARLLALFAKATRVAGTTVVGDGLVPSRRALRARIENAHAFSWQSTPWQNQRVRQGRRRPRSDHVIQRVADLFRAR